MEKIKSRQDSTLLIAVGFIVLLLLVFFLYSFRDTPDTVLLSFDVEPVDEDGSVLDILDILVRTDTKATFFFTGQYAEQYPEVVKTVYDAGQEVACHSYSHKRFTDIDIDQKKEEIALCESRLFDATGDVPLGFRAPYNAIDEETYEILEGRFAYDASQISGFARWAPEPTIPDIPVSMILYLPAEDVVWMYYLKWPKSAYFTALKRGSGTRSYLFHPHHIADPSTLESLESFITSLKASNVTFIKHIDFILLQNDNK